jgi:hypothetical protein
LQIYEIAGGSNERAKDRKAELRKEMKKGGKDRWGARRKEGDRNGRGRYA